MMLKEDVRCIRVALPLAHQSELYDYLVPSVWAIQRGSCVSVPFGRSTRLAYVIDVDIISALDTPLKTVHAHLVDRSLASDYIDWIDAMAKYYHWPIGQTLKVALPRLLWSSSHQAKLGGVYTLVDTLHDKLPSTCTKVQKHIVQCLKQVKSLHSSLLAMHDISSRSMQIMVDKGYLSFQPCAMARQDHTPTLHRLTEAQQAVVDRVMVADQYEAFLLDGVTGSGKTAVYCAWVSTLVKQGGQVLVLIPEIGLTEQTLTRFASSCDAHVAAWHSHLTPAAQFDLWAQVRAKQVDVIVGTRSAVFLPFACLKGIVVDEAHDRSFKQMSSLRYQTIDVAMMRAKQQNCPIVLGTATPSLSLIHRVETGKMTGVYLKKRISQAGLPPIQLVDMRAQKIAKGMSAPLKAQLDKRLEAGEQVMIFLNRRGYAPVLMCHHCGYSAACIHCDVPMTYHDFDRRLLCHHCGHQSHRPKQCPCCEQGALGDVGLGTEQVEAMMREAYPSIEIARLDRDTMSTSKNLVKTLSRIRQGKIQMIIGTQMIAKGHDWPGLTFVAMLDADAQLYSSDVFALEALGQMVWQVAGRAGRQGEGAVMIQTHQPEHPFWAHILTKGYHGLATWLMTQRKQACLPPYQSTAVLRISVISQEAWQCFFQQWQACQKTCESLGCQVVGPFPERIARKAGKYQYWIWLHAIHRAVLHQSVETGVRFLEKNAHAKVQWVFEIDPVELG